MTTVVEAQRVEFRAGAPTRIANTPSFIKGVVNLRGKSGHVERMVVLTDIQALMTSADMGLMEAAAAH